MLIFKDSNSCPKNESDHHPENDSMCLTDLGLQILTFLAMDELPRNMEEVESNGLQQVWDEMVRIKIVCVLDGIYGPRTCALGDYCATLANYLARIHGQEEHFSRIESKYVPEHILFVSALLGGLISYSDDIPDPFFV